MGEGEGERVLRGSGIPISGQLVRVRLGTVPGWELGADMPPGWTDGRTEGAGAQQTQ